MQLSVIIPTCNRGALLNGTLKALAGQTLLAEPGGRDWEVIIVDDGSTDSTPAQVFRHSLSFPVPLRYFFQFRRGAAAARNRGAEMAAGHLLIFLGDDTVPCRDFLQQHLWARRSRQAWAPRLAVIGYTRWPDSYPKTRFMEYVGEHGWQFGFALIEDPEDVPFNYFYTSNLSIPRRFLVENGGFDEDFPDCNWEDIELGLRLKEAGMRLVYHPAAVAVHFHPTSFRSFVRRQRRVGRSAWTFYRKHPRLASFLGIYEVPRYGLLQRLKLDLLTWLCSITEHARWPDLSRYYPDLMSYHYNLGLLQARHE